MSDVPRPFVKIAGGKRRLLPHLASRLPAKIGRYFEGFVGGGALFFHLRAEGRIGRNCASLADADPRLVSTYRGVRDDVERVLRVLREHERRHCRDYFEIMRRVNVELLDAFECAAWRIYLSRTAYNGLFRVNKQGTFNASFGDYDDPRIVDEENLRACSRVLADVPVHGGGYRDLLASRVLDGDVYYFDPPYVPTSATASFTAYTAEGFNEEAHRRLAGDARALKEAGATVVLTNSDASLVRELYPERLWRIERVTARADSINSDVSRRGRVADLVIS